MDNRNYFSVRTGTNKDYNINILQKLFKATFELLRNDAYFDESIGYHCVDEDYIHGSIGPNIELFILKKLRKDNLWPIEDFYTNYSEEDVFDMIELLYDLVSKPIDGDYHNWNDCGMHYHTFDKVKGREKFRKEINNFLPDYGEGWELSDKGEILLVGDEGLNNIFKADIPNIDEDNISSKIKRAIYKFRKHKSTMVERKEAVRELADVLEFLRPQVKESLLSKDESDLFNIANNFGIRHHNDRQKKDYDSAVWLSWIFYVYLSTTHLIIRLINRDKY